MMPRYLQTGFLKWCPPHCGRRGAGRRRGACSGRWGVRQAPLLNLVCCSKKVSLVFSAKPHCGIDQSSLCQVRNYSAKITAIQPGKSTVKFFRAFILKSLYPKNFVACPHSTPSFTPQITAHLFQEGSELTPQVLIPNQNTHSNFEHV